MAKYVSRPLSTSMLAASCKVLVLEGARAVGKTALVQHQITNNGFTYETLGNSNTFKQAANNLDTWVKSLRTPVVIDEAQRLPELPLAIKERIDGLVATSPQFILTGSASINRKGLNGQDPLTRRSRRFTLHPLTQRELMGIEGSVVDELYTLTPNEHFRGKTTRKDIETMMATGGFPRYAVEIPETHPTMSENERGLSIRNDIDGVLGDTLLPDEHLDKTIAQAILDALLSHPGEIINIAKIARDLQYNQRTVGRYISIFVNRFLVYSLPNLQLKSGKQIFTRSKMHPVDTSFSVETLRRSGVSIADDATAFGHVFESFVANQIIPAIQWSEAQPDCFFWRSKTQDEVDLVLMQNDRQIGIEVKSSDSVDSDDFKGLRSLKSSDARFYRGFVIYAGNRVMKWDEDLWAIPVEALWNKTAFRGESKIHTTTIEIAALEDDNEDEYAFAPVIDANVFLSYSHRDDDHLNGAIAKFIKAVAEEYEFQFANRLQVFIDKESINWGEDWRKAIQGGIDRTNFLVAAVTPTYLTRSSCRAELSSFYDRIQNSPSGKVLSLVWQDYAPFRRGNPDDPVLKIIDRHQHIRVDALQNISEQSPEYRQAVKQVVEQLRKAIEGLRANEEDTHAEAFSNTLKQAAGEEMGVVELAAETSQLMPRFLQKADNIRTGLEDIASLLNENPAPKQATPQQLLLWTREIAEQTRDSTEKLDKEIRDASASWDIICDTMGKYISLTAELPEGTERTSNLSGIEASLLSLRQAFSIPIPPSEIRATSNVLKKLSPRLKPLATSFENVIDLFSRMTDKVNELISTIRKEK